MKDQKGSSRMDTVLKMMLIAFISLLAFSSGVFFGKQLSDSDYQLKALEGDFSKTSTKTAEAKSGKGEENASEVAAGEKGGNPEDAINEEEVAAMSDKFVANEKGGAKEERSIASEEGHDAKSEANGEAKAESKEAAHGKPVAHESGHEAAHTAKAEKAEGKPDLSAAHKAAARVASNAAPTEAAPKHATEEARVPNSLPKTVGASADVEFTVQVASYPTMDAAKAKSDELKQKGFVAFPVEAQVGGKTWYRVSVGTFKTYKDATVYRAQFLKATNLTTAIVQKIQR